MITLRAREASAILLPEEGAGFARLDHAGRALLVPIPEGAHPHRGFYGSFLMAPWTNRLDGGRFVVDGVEHRMPINRPEEDTALHGFLRDMPWDVETVGDAVATLACRFDRTPFRGTARMTVVLAPDHLALTVALVNEADGPVPMGVGWHPYFARPPGTRLHLAARTVFGRDGRNLPIAPRPTAGIVGGGAAFDGLDAHLAGWDGVAELHWPDGSGLTLQAAGAWARNLHLFAPRGGRMVALEPVTHAPDAANRATSAAHGAMHVLAPGESLDASLMIHWR
jgi:aldose 1-epimerase